MHDPQTNPKTDPADQLPTRRPGALAMPHVHRDDVHPLAGIVEALVGEGFQVQAAENIADHIERYIDDLSSQAPKFKPRKVRELAASQLAPARPRFNVVTRTEDEVERAIKGEVDRRTADLNAKVDRLLELVQPKAADAPARAAEPVCGASTAEQGYPCSLNKGHVGVHRA